MKGDMDDRNKKQYAIGECADRQPAWSGDHTTFYIKKYAGFLEIKFDKDENSDEGYQRIKSMCDGIKK